MSIATTARRSTCLYTSLLLTWTAALLLTGATSLHARTIVVDVRGGADYPTIYQGVYNAADGDTVLVKPGVYAGDWNRDIEFGGRGITLVSSHGPSKTWIDCEGLGRAFKFESAEDSAAIVQGFTIRNGYSAYGGSAILAGGTSPRLLDLVIEDCRTPPSYWYVRGGAIRCNASAAPLIRGVVFSGNSGGHGGGVLCYGGACPVIESCTFAGNRGSYGGGAVYCDASSPTIRHSVLALSTAGGGLACAGTATPTVEECIIYGNAGGDEPCGDVLGWLSEDPLFCDAPERDFEVCDDSPCLPENNPFGTLIGARGAGSCDCPQPPAVLHVPGEFPTILEALTEASFGDTVLVAPGTYPENELEIPWGVSLVATDGPDVTMIEAVEQRCVTFGADISDALERTAPGDSSRAHAVAPLGGSTAAPLGGPTAVLDGFTLTGATAGAVRITAVSPVIRNCIISGNSSYEGAAIKCDRVSRPTIEDCLLIDNLATAGTSDHGGGAVCVAESAELQLVRTIVRGNTAAYGAAVYVSPNATVAMSNCSVVGNTASEGGGIHVWNGTIGIEASVLAYAIAGDPIQCTEGSDILTTHSIVHGNAVTDTLCGAHHDNIFSDPQFCAWGAGDLTVCAESPCLPQNNPFGVLIGSEGDGGCPCPESQLIFVPADFASIAEAAEHAESGDTILVSPGTYHESEIRLQNGVTLRSVGGSDSTLIATPGGTAIRLSGVFRDADKPATPAQVEMVRRAMGRSPVSVSGFSITGATTSAIQATWCHATLEDMKLVGNTVSELGGGIDCRDSWLEVRDSEFIDNASTGTVRGCHGGAIYCLDSGLLLERVLFRGNSATEGGAVKLYASGAMDDIDIVDCVFQGNTADKGAALHTYGLGPTCVNVTGSTFVRNVAAEGSAIAGGRVTYVVENSVIAFPLWGNSLHCGNDGSISLTHCVLFADPEGPSSCATLRNVVFEDPLFCDLIDGDLHVCGDSPCLPGNGHFDELAGAFGDGGCECPSADGRTIRVPSDQPTITDALLRAEYADTILISPGVYSESKLHVPWGVCVIGESGAENTIIDAGGSGVGFTISAMYSTTGDPIPARLSNLTVLGADDSAVQARAGCPIIEHCIIRENSGYQGGGLLLTDGCEALVVDVLFEGNSSAWERGGAVHCRDGSNAEFERCTFIDNTSKYGGALSCAASDIIITACTLAGNNAPHGSSVYSSYSSVPRITNSILAFGEESAPIYTVYGATAVTTHSIVYGNAVSDSLIGMHSRNLFVDPYFCDWTNADCGVHANSSALPHNNDWYEQIGAWGQNCGYSVVSVRADGTGDVPTIQAGVDMCEDGGTVIAEDGVFTGPGNRAIDMGGRPLRIASRNGPEYTSIDCEDEARAFLFADGEDTTSIVRGFTIINGVADDGGGILISGASPLIADCVFHGCDAARGGAVACIDASPIMRNMSIDTSSASDGGAIWTSGSAPHIAEATFIDNSADTGGAISAGNGSNVVLRSAEFIQNVATQSGGAVRVSNGEATLTNATMLANAAGGSGAAVSCVDSDMTIAGCIVANSTQAPVTECVGEGGPTFSFCDFYGNEGGDEFCGTSGAGNISQYPRFCDFGSWDLSLCEDSPCLDPDAPSGHIGRYPAECDSCGAATVVLFVRPDGTGDVPTLQEAIDTCPEEGTVLASVGTFTGEGNRNLDLTGKGITVKSIGGSAGTTIDCGGESRGFTLSSSEDGASVIRGFTIANGAADEGGGILCDDSSPILDDVVIEACTADLGGGIALTNGASPAISNAVITACSAYQGGGLACAGGSAPDILEIRIEANTATYGAGLWMSGSSPDISHIMLNDNTAADAGGGAFITAGSTPMIRLATVSGNEAGVVGGALSSEASALSIENATFVGNAAPSSGALAFSDSDAEVTACIVTLTNDGQAAVCTGTAQPTFTDCIFYQNALGDELCGLDGGGNMIEDPLFCDAVLGDLTVCADSPCLVPGVSGGQIGRYGAGCDSCGTDYYSVLADGSGDLPTIQAAVDVCDFGDVIVVGAGTFSGDGNRNIDFGGKRIKLRTVLGPEHTTIDCEGLGRAFRFASGEDTLSVARGFTITGGREGDGGAILASGSSPLIEDCIIRDCSAERGGAIACANNASPLLRRLDIIGNEADHGGGIHASSGTPMLRDIVFRGNTATGNGGGLTCRSNTHLDMRRAALIDNSAEGHGGGVYCSLSAPVLENVTFVGNAAPTGGALASVNAAPHLNGCILSFSMSGEAMFCEGTLAAHVEHCVLHGNAAGDEICGVDGGDNHFVDPLFCDLPGGDLTLCENSVCIRPVAPEFHVGMYGAGCDSCGATTDVPDVDPRPVSALRLSALPNPFTGETTVHFELPVACGDVTLRVYNLRGQVVRALVDGARPAGRWQAAWDGQDDSGRRAASGVYFCRLTASGESATTRIVLLH